jgi:uncharacterized protein (TIGR00725 family)
LVAVIGDAGAGRSSVAWRLAHAAGRALIDGGYRVATGGLGGVMEAALAGARASTHYQPGDTIALLPGADPDEANEYADVVLATGMDVGRNALVARCDAVVAVGGGAGTLSEIAMAWTLRRPVLALPAAGWSRELAGRRLDRRDRHVRGIRDQVHPVRRPQDLPSLLAKVLPCHQRRASRLRRAHLR